MDTIKLGIGADHAGYEYKEAVRNMLKNNGYDIKDYGTYTPESVDYPDYVHPLCRDIENDDIDVGILICGSGQGVCMTANKYPTVKAALCWENDIAVMSRRHNNANVICLPSRFVSVELAKEMTQIFLNTEFEGGRHQRRVEKIPIGG